MAWENLNTTPHTLTNKQTRNVFVRSRRGEGRASKARSNGYKAGASMGASADIAVEFA